MQAAYAAADERARRLHGDAGIIRRDRQHRAVGDERERRLELVGRRARCSCDALDDAGDALADADAHGDERIAPAGAVQLADRGQREPRARRAQRMADGDGAAIGIDARVVEIDAPAA